MNPTSAFMLIGLVLAVGGFFFWLGCRLGYAEGKSVGHSDGAHEEHMAWINGRCLHRWHTKHWTPQNRVKPVEKWRRAAPPQGGDVLDDLWWKP